MKYIVYEINTIMYVYMLMLIDLFSFKDVDFDISLYVFYFNLFHIIRYSMRKLGQLEAICRSI